VKRLIFLLVLLVLINIPLASAYAAAPTTEVSYDFNSLTGSDTPPFTNLDGQDNWTSNGFIFDVPIPEWYVGVTETLGFDGTPALRFQRVGPGYGADASRLNDSSFSIPDYGVVGGGFFQADFCIGYWGNFFAMAYDGNTDGKIRKTSPDEIGPQLVVGSHANVQIRVISADGVTTTTSLADANGATGGDWIRLRLVMDFTANGGHGLGSVYYQNLSAGDTMLQPLAGLQDINLGLDLNATDGSNPALWNAMWLHMEGATNQLDNIVLARNTPPPGWDKGEKSGWDGAYPPGLDNNNMNPPGFNEGNKGGWSVEQ
jgi:hypothetical protein